ncbi:hypothetical protein SAMN00790413_02515 [Deinococcus hopiensis KR-140]|uniref:Uncharacterized protein n=1 Tax=Deinococcus hopiensis KR-140 TaxID=695939 RepID=A0A1W1VN21_9DEIO|nr:hypothetical protein SAMN00790413_02515 [Deinococcus hopiensis KR-140]
MGLEAARPDRVWAGVLAGNLYDLALLDRLASDEAALPLAVALTFASRSASPSAFDDFRTRERWSLAPSSARKRRTFGRRYGVEVNFAMVRRNRAGAGRPCSAAAPVTPSPHR